MNQRVLFNTQTNLMERKVPIVLSQLCSREKKTFSFANFDCDPHAANYNDGASVMWDKRHVPCVCENVSCELVRCVLVDV